MQMGLALPMTQLMMPAAVAALGLGYIALFLAKLPAIITSLALTCITGAVRGLGGLRLADLRVAMPSLLLSTLAVAALTIALSTARKRAVLHDLWINNASPIFAGSRLFAASAAYAPDALEVTSIDVGEGDSTLLITPKGKTLLVDAGSPIAPGGSQLDFGEDVVSPDLWSRGISSLDAVAITHGHSDHIGGMIAVLKNFRPKELWWGWNHPGTRSGTSTRQRMILGSMWSITGKATPPTSEELIPKFCFRLGIGRPAQGRRIMTRSL